MPAGGGFVEIGLVGEMPLFGRIASTALAGGSMVGHGACPRKVTACDTTIKGIS